MNKQLSAMFKRASALYIQGKDEDAIAAFEKALEKADNIMKKSKNANEITECTEAKAEAYAFMAMSYHYLDIGDKENEYAKKAMAIINEQKSSSNSSYIAQAITTIATLDNPEFNSEELFEYALKCADTNALKAKIYSAYAHFLSKQGKDSQAVAILRSAVLLPDIEKEKNDLFAKIGYYLIRDGDYIMAEQYLNLALKDEKFMSNDSLSPIYGDLAYTYLALGEYEKALSYQKKHMTITPKNARDDIILMEIHVGNMNYDEAISIFNKMTENMSPEEEVLLYLAAAKAFSGKDDYKQALKHCTLSLKAADLPNLKSDVHTVLANIYYFMGKYNDALRNAEQALDYADTNNKKINAYLQFGFTYAKTNDYDEAQKSFNNAIKIAQEDNNAIENYIKAQLIEMHVDMYYDWIINKSNNKVLSMLRENILAEINELKQHESEFKHLTQAKQKYVKNTIKHATDQLSMKNKIDIRQMAKLCEPKSLELFLAKNNIDIIPQEDIDQIRTWTLLPLNNLIKKNGKIEEADFSSGLSCISQMLEFYTTGIYWKYLDYCENKYAEEGNQQELSEISLEKQEVSSGKVGLAHFVRKITPYDQYGTPQANKTFIEFLKTLPYGQSKTDDELEDAVLDFYEKIDLCRKARNHSSHKNIDTKNEEKITPNKSNRICMNNFITISNLVLFQKDSVMKDINEIFGDFFVKNDNLELDKKQKTLDDFVM